MAVLPKPGPRNPWTGPQGHYKGLCIHLSIKNCLQTQNLKSTAAITLGNPLNSLMSKKRSSCFKKLETRIRTFNKFTPFR